MKRRDFFTAASSLLLPVAVNGFGIKSLTKNSALISSLLETTAAYGDRILVVIYLDGGNDGLNTVIPLDQYSTYDALRHNIAIPENSVLKIGNAKTGLHPSMVGMKNLYTEGKLAIIHSVAYPNPSKSHIRSTDIYMTAVESDQFSETGWAGRYLKNRYPGYPEDFPNDVMKDPLAVEISSLASTSTFGNKQSMAVSIQNPEAFYNMIGGQDTAYSGPVSCCESGEMVKYVRQQQMLAVDYASRIKTASEKGRNLAAYPTDHITPIDLSEQLKVVARLIDGGLQSKIYFVSLSGFDTHAEQVSNTNNTVGDHATLLQKLSDGITSFQNDLKLQGREDKVIGMTFSDFGRRASSNASKGTDHGVAAPMFVFGTNIKKQEIGTNPDLTNGLLPTNPEKIYDDRDIAMQIDFRRVYSDILNDWFGTNQSTTNSLLFRNFSTISLFSDVTETIASGSWPDKNIWSTGIVPTSKDYVKINAGHTVSIGENISVKNVQMDGELVFLGAFNVTING